MPLTPIAAPMQKPERVRLIAERAGRANRGYSVLYRGRYHEFPTAAIPQGSLVYRVDNGRLLAALEERAARQGLSLAELRARAETAEVQSLLHELLLAKAKDPDGPIHAELERLGQQTDPLLVTADGLVINGNRRLSAMRDLFARDAARYPFGEPLVAVLPADIQPRDIEYIEASLQMAPETKLQYGWLDRRLKLRQQRDVLKLPAEEICAAYRIKDAAAIATEIAELDLAEDYLRDYRREPAHYSAIADAEALFVGLREQLANLRRADRQFWRLAGFVMIDGRPETPAQQRPAAKRRGDRPQNPFERLFPFASPVPPQVARLAARRLAVRFGVATDPGPREAAPLDDPSRSDIMAVFRDRGKSRQTAKQIADVLDELRLEHNERREPKRVLQKLREAGQLIARLEPKRLSPQQWRELRGELAALQSQAAFLLGDSAVKPKPAARNVQGTILRPPYTKVPFRLLRRLGWRDSPSR